MTEIAKRAGVSRTTVSYVLNNNQRDDGSIGEETRQRVLEAAASLGYHVNELARSMIAGRARMLAILMDDYDFEVKFRLVSGILEAAYKAGYLVKIVHLPHKIVTAEAVASCLKWRVSGIVVIDPDLATVPTIREELKNRPVPVAIINAYEAADWCLNYMPDDAAGVLIAIDHLRSLGHRKIALFNGPDQHKVSNLREAAYLAEIKRRASNLVHCGIVRAEWTSPSESDDAARRLLALPQRPTGVVCSSDAFAMALIRQARALGLRVPQDLSIVGFANYFLAQFSDPAVTTIDQPFHELGREAGEALIRFAESKRKSTRPPKGVHLLPTALIPRASCAMAPA